MKRTILITGGAGFIGSNFFRYLYDKYEDYYFIILDQLTYAGSVENLPPFNPTNNKSRFKFWYGNVCNGELVDTLVSQADIVVHFAAESHVTRSIYDNLLFFQTDVLGTQIISNAVCKYSDRIERFIHVSTSEVYGTALREVVDEEHPLKPMSPYASAKCGADRLVYSYFATYDIPMVIVRPFNNFGPYQHLEKVIPRFVTSALLNEKLTIHGNGQAARDFLYVEDCCKAIDMILHYDIKKTKGQVINIGSGIHRSILDIGKNILRLMGKNENMLQFIGDRPGQVFRHTAGISKIKRLINWEPSISFEDGLKKTIQWYKDNRKWWERQLWMRHIPIITKRGKYEWH